MSRLDVDRAVPIPVAKEVDAWLETHGDTEPDIVIAIHKGGSGKRSVTLEALQKRHSVTAGWTRRTSGSTTSAARSASFHDVPVRPGDRRTDGWARRMVKEAGLSRPGFASLPDDL